MSKDFEHELLTKDDQRVIDNPNLWDMVVEGGLAICKRCGGGEADLTKPCFQYLWRFSEVFKDHPRIKRVAVVRITAKTVTTMGLDGAKGHKEFIQTNDVTWYETEYDAVMRLESYCQMKVTEADGNLKRAQENLYKAKQKLEQLEKKKCPKK